VSAEFKFRVRDANAALEGDVDAQVLLELLISSAVGGWLLARRAASDLFRDPRLPPLARRLLSGSPLALLRFITLGFLISSFWSPTSIATVRAMQLVVLVELGIEACLVCRGSEQALAALRKAFAVGLTAATAVAALLTFSLPSFDPFLTTYVSTFRDIDRFRLLFIHPIATATLLGVIIVLTANTIIASRDRPSSGRVRQNRAIATLVLLAALSGLILTRQRGSSLAAFVAVGILLVLASDRAWRSRVGLLTAGVGLAVVTALRPALDAFITRGQDGAAIASLSGRRVIFDEALDIFMEHPVTGLGYLAGRSVFLPTIPWAGQSHNVLIEIVVSSGLVGLLAYLALFARWFRTVRRGLRRQGVSRICAADSVALVALATVSGVSDDSFAGPPRLPATILVLALALAELTAGPAQNASLLHRPWRRHANA